MKAFKSEAGKAATTTPEGARAVVNEHLKQDVSEEMEAFRKALLLQAYNDFLNWAWKKDELLEEWIKYTEYMDTSGNWHSVKSFKDWVTETYWGETDE